MSTTMAKPGMERKWYIIDAAGKPLGRTAEQAAGNGVYQGLVPAARGQRGMGTGQPPLKAEKRRQTPMASLFLRKTRKTAAVLS